MSPWSCRSGIAVALDGDGARVALDPRRGGAEAVAQAALNVACCGAQPAAITNCLNFGNPERPGTAYALREAITGMAEACEVLLSAQRARGLPAPGSAVTRFWDRPFRTVDDAIAQALLADIADPRVRRLPAGIGSVEQWADNVDVLASPGVVVRRAREESRSPAKALP